MAGPLFRELAEDLALKMPENSILFTGHPDTLLSGSRTSKLIISSARCYDRRSYLTRAFSWLHYSLSAFLQMLKVEKNTVIFIVSNPPILGIFVLIINFFKGTYYVVLVYDIHPDALIGFGILKKNSMIAKVWKLVNRKLWEKSTAVFTIGNIMAENLSNQFDVKNTNLGYVGVIPPWADTNKIKPIDKSNNPLTGTFSQDGKITVLYSGNMGVSHDMDSILQSAYLLKDELDISFLLIGGGEKWQDAVDFKMKNSLSNLQIFPFQPEDKLPYTMTLADIALVSLDDGAEGLMVPSKMFYYMAGGAAIIGISRGDNDVSEVIQTACCGLTVEPKNPIQLALSIKELAKNPTKLNAFKHAARRSAVANFSRDVCAKKLHRELLPLINHT